MSHSSFDVTEFENMMSLDNPINSKAIPRWERKARQQSQTLPSDRYIPNRSAMEYDINKSCSNDENHENSSSETSAHAKLILANTSASNSEKGARVLSFKNKAPLPREDYQNSLKIIYSQNGSKKEICKPTRHISSTPYRILDAPDMLDDYYLNLLSWSSTNVLAVALSQCVYTWDAASGNIKELMNVDSEPNEYISSVSWIQQGGTHLAIGTSTQNVQLWDVQAGKQVRTLGGHSARVGALAWNGHLLSTGSKDNTVLTHDVRIQNHIVGKMSKHTQEVCGLAWSPDGSYLASGANDNTLCIMDGAQMQSSLDVTPKFVLNEHQAAVKALAWCPHERNLLATGGGTADRCIKFWNAASGTMINSIDTGSQVCALQWSPFKKELLSSHGYAENQLCLWNYPSMVRIKELKGHTSRVLHLATSPDGSSVCSGAADETLRFWNVFASDEKSKMEGSSNVLSAGLNSMHGNNSLRIR